MHIETSVELQEETPVPTMVVEMDSFQGTSASDRDNRRIDPVIATYYGDTSLSTRLNYTGMFRRWRYFAKANGLEPLRFDFENVEKFLASVESEISRKALRAFLKNIERRLEGKPRPYELIKKEELKVATTPRLNENDYVCLTQFTSAFRWPEAKARKVIESLGGFSFFDSFLVAKASIVSKLGEGQAAKLISKIEKFRPTVPKAPKDTPLTWLETALNSDGNPTNSKVGLVPLNVQERRNWLSERIISAPATAATLASGWAAFSGEAVSERTILRDLSKLGAERVNKDEFQLPSVNA